nr:hypothetical protein [Tanacetum cinerariifolium]
MDDPNITMEEYIMLEEEKARRCSKVHNWETTTYGNIRYDEDIHDLRSVETEFLAILFNDTLMSEPMVSSLNNEIDFRISFDESDDEDYTLIYDKNSFSYKIIFVDDLKTNSENDNDKVNMPSFSSPEPTVSYFDDLDYFKYFEKEFQAIVYNDALTSKLDFLTEPTVSPQYIDEFNLKDETSLSKYDEEEQNVLYFNDIFPFSVTYPDDSKSDRDNDDDKINIKLSSVEYKVNDLALSVHHPTYYETLLDQESIKDFMQRFKAESSQVKGVPECMRISGFMHGITNPELFKRMHEKIPKSVDEMMRITPTFLRGEVAASNQARKKTLSRSERRPGNFTLLTKSLKEILALDKGKFKALTPMTTPLEKRNNKFCEFLREVGHNTDKCMHLRRQNKKLIKSGKLLHVIKELKQGKEKDQPKAAKNGETPGKDKPLEILMAPSRSKKPNRDAKHFASTWMNFLAVRSSSPYNGIIGRPGMRKIQAVLSTALGMLKFLFLGGILTLRSSRIIPLKCTMVFVGARS